MEKENEEKFGRSVITSKNASELNQVAVDLIENISRKMMKNRGVLV